MNLISILLTKLMPIKPVGIMGIQIRPQLGDPDGEWRWNGHEMDRVEEYICTKDNNGMPVKYYGMWLQRRPLNDNEIQQLAAGIINKRHKYLCNE